MGKDTEHINNLGDLQCPDRDTEDREDRKDHGKKNNSHENCILTVHRFLLIYIINTWSSEPRVHLDQCIWSTQL